ncbi:MAG: DUF5062 family protein [Pseudomonadales bacterium]
MKMKPKQEAQLLKEALRIGEVYMKNRGLNEFKPTDSSSLKVTQLYHLLTQDKLIAPLAKDQEDEPHMKHKLALWIAKQLPEGHPLKSD